MDTEWFAVDEAGRVARFYSEEDGAVPEDAAFGLSPADESFDVALLNAFLLGRLLAKGLGPELVASLKLPSPERVVVVAERLEPYADLVEAGRLDVARERDPVVLLTRGEADGRRLRELAGRPGFRGFISGEDLWRVPPTETSEDGLLRFQHPDGDDPDYYSRDSMPAEPLRAEDLPASIRAAIGSLKLPVDFTAVEKLHLGDYLEANSIVTWGNEPLRLEPLEVAGEKAASGATGTSPSSQAGAARSPAMPRGLWLPVMLLLAALAAWLLLN
jgi:hypothetical protein